MQTLAKRGAIDPMEAVEDEGQRARLAQTLLAETEPPAAEAVEGAIASLQQRQFEGQLRELRTHIAEAERRGDFAELALLTQRKLELDRKLRQLRGSKPAADGIRS
jgi:DNA primase